LTKEQVFAAVLQICDVLCNRYNTEELCESIVAEIELRALYTQFQETTIIGQARQRGIKVRFENRTFHG
jgi:hypothetical protein